MTYREACEQGARILSQHGIAEAKLDARLLMEYVCHTDCNFLYAHGDRGLDEVQYETYVNYITRRAGHIPLQYLMHVQEFMGLKFYVNKQVLIPRQDTEILVEEVMRYMQDGMEILDLCTGSGCVLLSLLHYSNHCFGVGTDISPEALAVAEENAGSLGISEGGHEKDRGLTQREGAEVLFRQGDLYEALGAADVKFDIIVSNPPYIRSEVIPTLMPEVRDHEPLMALDGGADGLDFYRRITDGAHAYAKKESALFLEIGADQGAAVRALMEQAGYRDVCVVKDYAGLDRVVWGVRF